MTGSTSFVLACSCSGRPVINRAELMRVNFDFAATPGVPLGGST